MPQYCEDCDLSYPDAVSLKEGTVGVKYCVACGSEVDR